MNMIISNTYSGWTLILVTLLFCTACNMSLAADSIADHRVNVKIDGRITIVRPTKGFERAMLGMVRHPDGTIFVNTQTLGLYKSSDNGKTWTASPVNFDSSVPTGQKLHGNARATPRAVSTVVEVISASPFQNQIVPN